MSLLSHALSCAILLALLPIAAAAHVAATGLAAVTVDGPIVSYRLTVAPGELPGPAGRWLTQTMAGDRVQAERVADAMRHAVTVRIDGTACRPGRVAIQDGGIKATLDLTLHCPTAPGRLELDEDWSDLFGPHYLTIATMGGSEHLLGGDRRRVSVDFGAPAPSGLAGFVRLGVMHIMTGYDHLLFLMALLIGASSVWRVLGIASAFTLAHSITLSLAVLGVVQVPGTLVEPLIATSIVFVAVENLVGAGPPWRRLAVTFIFGLVHGLGFAGALKPLALSGWSMARALFGFNLGVELGQAAAIVVALPVMFAIGRAARAIPVERYASLAVAAAGAWWLVERIAFE